MVNVDWSMDDWNRYGVRDLAAPWYSGFASFLRAPIVTPEQVPEGDIAIVGVPFGQFATSVGRTGMRWGPRKIREASLNGSMHFGIQADSGLINMSTGAITRWPERMPLVDAGDVPILPASIEDQIDAAASYVAAVSRTSACTVTLGGDHFSSYPASEGVIAGWRDRREGLKVGHLHIDAHTDFVDFHHHTGRHQHGSCARRIAEIPELHRMAWFGVSTSTQPNQLLTMRERGFQVATADFIARVGPAEAMRRVLDYVLDGVDILYVSVDIDVINGSEAPGTACATFRGLSAAVMLEALAQLADVEQMVALDICEVDPEVDRSGRTERLAVELLGTVLGRRLYEDGGRVPPDELAQVVLS